MRVDLLHTPHESLLQKEGVLCRPSADSSVICAYLERIHPMPALYPMDPVEYAKALWFEEYGDSELACVLAVPHTNIRHPPWPGDDKEEQQRTGTR